jgi:hypothetical protein
MPKCLCAFALLLTAGVSLGQSPQKQALAEIKFKEGRVMSTAWVYLKLANENYNGHRAKAMHELEHAVRTLNKAVARDGGNWLKVAANADNLTAMRVRFLREHAPNVTNPQQISNLYLTQAAAILVQLRPTLIQLNQPKMLKHVDTAIVHIRQALATK